MANESIAQLNLFAVVCALTQLQSGLCRRPPPPLPPQPLQCQTTHDKFIILTINMSHHLNHDISFFF